MQELPQPRQEADQQQNLLRRHGARLALAAVLITSACTAKGEQSFDDDSLITTSTTEYDAPSSTAGTLPPPPSPDTTAGRTPEAPATPLDLEPGYPAGFGGHILAYANRGNINIERILDEVNSINVDHVAFNPPLFHDLDTGVIQPYNERTPNQANVETLARLSTEQGTPFVFKGILDNEALGDSWRGNFVPENPDAWFASYFSATDELYAAAYTGGSRRIVIGTEMTALEGPAFAEYWTSEIARLKATYPGTEVFYNPNWDSLSTPPAFVSSLDGVGVSAYWPFNDTQSFSDQWQPIIARIKNLEAQTGTPYYIGEGGLSNTSLLSEPWGEDKKGETRTPNPQQVADYLAAGCIAFEEAGLAFTVWGASYAGSWIENGVNYDSTNGFYFTRENNQNNEVIRESVRDNC